MKSSKYAVISLIGFAIMLFSYYSFQKTNDFAQWQQAVMCVSTDSTEPQTRELDIIKIRVRFLPMSQISQAFEPMVRNQGSSVARSYESTFREKMIPFDDMKHVFEESMLLSGRPPVDGANEAVAGYSASQRQTVSIQGKIFKIVGHLRKELAPLSNSYLVAPDRQAEEDIFTSGIEGGQLAYILQPPGDKAPNPEIIEKIKAAFPKERFSSASIPIRAGSGPYYLYLLGMTLLLLAGSVLICQIYFYLADIIQNGIIGSTLEVIKRYRVLFIVVHIVFFLTGLFFMAVIYLSPQIQWYLLASLRMQDTGPLAIAARAYGSGNILRAAAVTFLINFPLGSFASITLPSIILPGIGVIITILRSVMWGLLLAPTFLSLSSMMLPHSFTLLLEGHAYVVATFFAILIPVYLCRRAEGPTFLRRYGRAVVLNIKGCLIIIIVLMIAAIYEAIEIILCIR